MLKHDIKNYSRQFTKTLIICLVLVMYNYVWVEQLNACATYRIISDKTFSLLDKICELYKVS